MLALGIPAAFAGEGQPDGGTCTATIIAATAATAPGISIPTNIVGVLPRK